MAFIYRAEVRNKILFVAPKDGANKFQCFLFVSFFLKNEKIAALFTLIAQEKKTGSTGN